ncbi:MAG: hypothetical protein Faunusvirus3_29 [Faunusvirus sp.]|jgi:ankyrin repeat protein|uniref:Uncharacterized protein n=1 Tax=Faunusvirus sp. TaxID=2487766 RepID=A0A3G5A0R6_9VIRU|nr:MAG: hypothetical protein Faunusvirus3_29 [Faunusvirus sp.]
MDLKELRELKEPLGAMTNYIENKNVNGALMLLNRHPNVKDLRIRDYNGTPLIHACRYGLKQLCVILIKKNADLNIQTKDGFTALMYACFHGMEYVAMELINSDCDISIKSNSGKHAIRFAIIKKLNKVAIALATHNKFDVMDQGREALELAVKYNLDDVVIKIIIAFATHDKFNVVDQGRKILELAVKYNLDDIVIKLIDRGANYTGVDKLSSTVLEHINNKQKN